MNYFKCLKKKSPSCSTPFKPENLSSGSLSSNSHEIFEELEPTLPGATRCNKANNVSSHTFLSSSAKSESSLSSVSTLAHIDVNTKSKIFPEEIISSASSSLLYSNKSVQNPADNFTKTKNYKNRKRLSVWSIINRKSPKKDEILSSKAFRSPDATLDEYTIFCNICLQNIPLTETFLLEECQCRFCITCLRMYIEVKVEENGSIMRCPQSDCKLLGEMTEKDVRALTNKDNYQKFLKIREEMEVTTDPGRIWCPIPNCGSIVLLRKPTISGEQTSCPTCSKTFCAECSTPWNMNSEHQCLDELIKLSELIKRCPKCYVPIERDSGCAQISCQKCHHLFCWYCLKSIQNDYLLLHYTKGKCRGKLGHSRAVLWTLRVAMFFAFLMTGAVAIVWVPCLIAIVGPCYLCKKNKRFKKSYDKYSKW